MSGLETISIKGTPARLKSTWLAGAVSRLPSWISLPTSSSR